MVLCPGVNFWEERKLDCPEETLKVRLRSTETQSTYYINFVVEVEGVIDVHYASLTSQWVQHRVFYLDGHPSRYQPRPTGFNFGKQTGTGVFPLVISVPSGRECELSNGWMWSKEEAKATLNWRRGINGMASNIGYKQFPAFNVWNDPETVYARFIKYAKWFKNNHLKGYNITGEDQQRLLFLDSIGEATLDIFKRIWTEPSPRYGTSSRSRKTGCSIYTNFAALNKAITKPGIHLSQS